MMGILLQHLLNDKLFSQSLTIGSDFQASIVKKILGWKLHIYIAWLKELRILEVFLFVNARKSSYL